MSRRGSILESTIAWNALEEAVASRGSRRGSFIDFSSLTPFPTAIKNGKDVNMRVETTEKKSDNENEGRFAKKLCITPSWLALTFLCTGTFLQGFVVNGLVNVTITPLQARFKLSSVQAGYIASSYDIGGIITVLPVTFLFGRFNKSLVIGLSFILLGIGTIIYSLPHFLAEGYTEIVTKLQSSSNDTLNGQCAVFDSDCDGNLVTSNTFYYGFFIAGQALNGIGAQALWTLGAVYIDENFSQSGAPMALGLFEGMGVLGPAVGFLLGGAFLAIWIDGGEAPAGFTPDDELWIGNWWLGFVIGGCLALLTGILIALLPATLSTAKENQKTRRQEFHKGQTEMTTEKTGKISDIHKSSWILFQNLPFLFIILAGGFETGFVSILSTYAVLYVETMYNVATSTAAIACGATVVVSGAFGQFLGGIWVGKTNPTVRRQIIFAICCLFISLLGSFYVFYFCEETPLVGANLSYGNALRNDTTLDILGDYNRATFENSCSGVGACNCTLAEYDPICVDERITFFSPCHAGCDSRNISQITNCGCVGSLSDNDVTGVSSGDFSERVSFGSCDSHLEGCHFEVFLGLIFIVLFFTFVNGIPATNAILRVVPPELRSQAMGLNIMILRLIGSIPGPIIGGKLIDTTCIAWQEDCGSTGNCRLYDRHSLAMTWFGLHMVYKVIGLFLWGLALYSYKPETIEPQVSDLASISNEESKTRRKETKPEVST